MSQENQIKKLEQQIEALEKRSVLYKQINAYYKKHGNLEEFNLITEEEKAQIFHVMNRMFRTTKPIQTWQLSNIRQNIKAKKEQIEELKRREQIEGSVFNFNEGKVVLNSEAQRLQIFFNDIPAEELRSVLKRRGFKWSPSNSAWQRILTTEALRVAKQILNIN